MSRSYCPRIMFALCLRCSSSNCTISVSSVGGSACFSIVADLTAGGARVVDAGKLLENIVTCFNSRARSRHELGRCGGQNVQNSGAPWRRERKSTPWLSSRILKLDLRHNQNARHVLGSLSYDFKTSLARLLPFDLGSLMNGFPCCVRRELHSVCFFCRILERKR
jgi:hypothetical protein